MSSEERKKHYADRDAAICAEFLVTQNSATCAKKFDLTRQRVQQILKKAGVTHNRSARTEFLGISVSEPTKRALREKAEAEGVSVSKLTADALDSLVKAE